LISCCHYAITLSFHEARYATPIEARHTPALRDICHAYASEMPPLCADTTLMTDADAADAADWPRRQAFAAIDARLAATDVFSSTPFCRAR
jgi:hypothetical protein